MSNNVNVSLRPVTDADQEFLVGVYASTRAAELAQVDWDDSQKDAFVRWQFAMQKQDYDLRYPDSRQEVILVDDQPAGRIWLGIDDTQIRLLDIALLTEFQSRGVGSYLLQQLIDEARRANKPIRHMVFMFNDDAHRFYEQLGFVTTEDVGGYKHMEWRAEQDPNSSAK
jgi:GNAT superfamily N-acetyltransferase